MWCDRLTLIACWENSGTLCRHNFITSMHAFPLRLCFLGEIVLVTATATAVWQGETAWVESWRTNEISSHTAFRWMNDGLCNAFSVVYAFKWFASTLFLCWHRVCLLTLVRCVSLRSRCRRCAHSSCILECWPFHGNALLQMDFSDGLYWNGHAMPWRRNIVDILWRWKWMLIMRTRSVVICFHNHHQNDLFGIQYDDDFYESHTQLLESNDFIRFFSFWRGITWKYHLPHDREIKEEKWL